MTKKIVQSVRIKPLEIHRSGNEKFLVRLGYGRIFGPEFAARTRIFARELKSLETDFSQGRGACDLEKKSNQPISSPMYPKWSPETPKSFVQLGLKGRGSISGWAWYLYFQPGTKIATLLWIGVETNLRALKCVASSHQWGQVPELSFYLVALMS